MEKGPLSIRHMLPQLSSEASRLCSKLRSQPHLTNISLAIDDIWNFFCQHALPMDVTAEQLAVDLR